MINLDFNQRDVVILSGCMAVIAIIMSVCYLSDSDVRQRIRRVFGLSEQGERR